MRRFLFINLCALSLFGQSDPAEYFEKRVRPVLVRNCQPCHNAKVKTAGLDLSSAEGYLQAGPSGPLVSKDSPDTSLLLRAINYEGQLKMPPAGRMKSEDIEALTIWAKSGGTWPGAPAGHMAVAPSKGGRVITDEDRNYWAFRPIKAAAAPDVKDRAWAKGPIDRFILAKLEEKGLKPAPPASKLALLRRITFNLTGLPPTEAEIQAFLGDTSPQAYEKVVDRLLASPRYGEKWARHWLDVARYADSTGNDEDHRYPYAWRYRDYVIDAFNSDMPYDQFLREQIAGDLMPGNDPGGINRRGIVATGFLALGAKAIAQQDKKKMLYDVYDEQVDVVSKAALGLTVSCARCHDHKFDPILTRDYYSMIGVFASTKSFKDPESHVSKLLFTPLVPKEQYEAYTAKQRLVTQKQMEMDDLAEQEVERHVASLLPKVADYMVASRRIYEKGEKAADVAKSTGLDEKLLERWAKYLKPQGASRVHLNEWEAADAASQPMVAKAYQARVEKELGPWSETISKWRERFRRMMAEMNMPPPERPKYDGTKGDRFFFETYFDGPLSVPKKEQEQVFRAETKARMEELKKEHEALKKALPPEPDMACAVEEGERVEQRVFLRGDYNNLGEPAPKAFPTVLAKGDNAFEAKGSGRLELANWLTRPDHPLTPRVMANRVWLWHFGEGIVRTPDNFGRMGEKPTHPELLDYLASRLVANDWQLKKLHREILLSNAYQMSSGITNEAMQADPENKLFSRFPHRRLTVEEMRDGLLAIDGSLDLTMGGTLQSGFGTDSENGTGRMSIKPESNKRRMVYIPLRRANLPAMLNLFDFGDATTVSGKRILTTVAPQALFMMNSGFVSERSRALAKAAMEHSPDASKRLDFLYLRVLNRMPEPAEKDQLLTYFSDFRTKFERRSEEDAWFSVSRVLVASNDFLYLD
jgi:hypothetical protein